MPETSAAQKNGSRLLASFSMILPEIVVSFFHVYAILTGYPLPWMQETYQPAAPLSA